MFLRIRHQTRFSYSQPVFLEPMTVRLRPRSDCWQKLHQFELTVDPSPEGRTDLVDLDGTSSAFLWFSGTHPVLNLTATSWVETLRENPFDFILRDQKYLEVPVQLSENYQFSLGPYLHRGSPSAKVDDFAREIAREVNQNTVSFLSTLCSRIHESFEITLRLTGDPMSPEELLSKKKGACRDFTVLFMDACRVFGLPARFTSGYYYGDEEFSDRELHAWAEVYLPGGGWRGYDPSVGLVVSHYHVALTSSPTWILASPTTGNFRGTGADSSLNFEIQMEKVDTLGKLIPSHHPSQE
ncbi:MAG: transglutaminase family protein [Nitrospinota bacterium]|nr:transglutaminase family protein [Nitrospinota bacterium]